MERLLYAVSRCALKEADAIFGRGRDDADPVGLYWHFHLQVAGHRLPALVCIPAAEQSHQDDDEEEKP